MPRKRRFRPPRNRTKFQLKSAQTGFAKAKQSSALAQNSCCVIDETGAGAVPSSTSQARNKTSSSLGKFTPHRDTPIIAIGVNVHFIIGLGKNSLFFPEYDEPVDEWSHEQVANSLINTANRAFTASTFNPDHGACPGTPKWTENFDTRIRFVRVGSSVIRHATLFNRPASTENEIIDWFGEITSYVDLHFTSTRRQMNIFVAAKTDKEAGPFGVANLPSPTSASQRLNTLILAGGYTSSKAANLSGWTPLVAHELGHLLGLRHTYAGGHGGNQVIEGDEEYMADVLGCDAGVKTSPRSQDESNLMDGGGYLISPLQAALMRKRLLRAPSLRKYRRHSIDERTPFAFGAEAHWVSSGTSRIAARGSPIWFGKMHTLTGPGIKAWAAPTGYQMWDGRWFTVPRPGVYTFSASAEATVHKNSSTLQIGIGRLRGPVYKGHVLAQSESHDLLEHTLSGSITLFLEQGDMVGLRIKGNLRNVAFSGTSQSA